MNDGNLKNTVDLNDPDYQFEARIFNAITKHPRVKLYFATRQKVTSKAIELIWGLIETENLAIAERQRDHMRAAEAPGNHMKEAK